MKIKFTLVDYIIIILVICAVIFAFIHITTDDSSNIQKTAFDSSTINKLPETYLNYYKDGHIVKATIEGFNSTVLIESNNNTYLAGLYKNVPNADIYIDKISIETDGSVYDNLTEFSVNAKNITSLNDLRKNITNANYDISTTIATNPINNGKMQELENVISMHSKRLAIKTTNTEFENQLIITKADKQTLDDGNSVLGNVSGVTEKITIRIYNCSDSDMQNIKNNYDVTNIRNF